MNAENYRGLALLVGMMYATDLFSAYMSSPWSTEAFGADEARAASARRLVGIAIAGSLAATGAASYLDKSPWPLVGGAVAAGMMWWLYEDALKKGQAAGLAGVDLSVESTPSQWGNAGLPVAA